MRNAGQSVKLMMIAVVVGLIYLIYARQAR